MPGPLSKALWSLLCFGHTYTVSLGQELGRARGQPQLPSLHQCLCFPSNSDKWDGSAPGRVTHRPPFAESKERRLPARVEGGRSLLEVTKSRQSWKQS